MDGRITRSTLIIRPFVASQQLAMFGLMLTSTNSRIMTVASILGTGVVTVVVKVLTIASVNMAIMVVHYGRTLINRMPV